MTIMDENVNWMKLEHIYVVNHFSRLNKTTHFFWCIIRILFNLVMEIPIEEIEEIQYLMNFGLTEIVFMVLTDGISCSESIVTSSHVSLVNCNISLYQFLTRTKVADPSHATINNHLQMHKGYNPFTTFLRRGNSTQLYCHNHEIFGAIDFLLELYCTYCR